MSVIVSLGRARPEEALEPELGALLHDLIEVEFSSASRSVLERWIESSPDRERWIDPGFLDGAPLAARELLFPARGENRLVVRDGSSEQTLAFDEEDCAAIAELFRVNDEPAFDELLESFAVASVESDGAVTQPWPRVDRPGIYRREHACLVIRSRNASLVVDPVTALGSALSGLDRAPPHRDVPDLAAVAITHSHRDHWHLPSILDTVKRAEVPVIVPAVPRVNLLCSLDFAGELGTFDQSAVAARWGETIRIADIEVDILPFRGEQPTAASPGPPLGVRNFGNCYRFTTEDFSVVVMVDAGPDPDGDVEEVLAASVDRRGPPDAIFACMRQFAAPFFGGLPFDWLTLPRERLAELWSEYRDGRLASVTQGAAGWAEAARRAGARYFLPYAHGFAGVGQPIDDVGWGLGETSELALLQLLGARLGASRCRAIEWSPGDAIHFRDQEAEVLRVPA